MGGSIPAEQQQLIADHQNDYEPSPLDPDLPDARPRRVRSRKAL